MSEKINKNSVEFKSSVESLSIESDKFVIPEDIEGIEAAQTKAEAEVVLDAIREKTLEFARQAQSEKSEELTSGEHEIANSEVTSDNFDVFFDKQGDFSTDKNLTYIDPNTEHFTRPEDLAKVKEVSSLEERSPAKTFFKSLPFVYPFISKKAA